MLSKTGNNYLVIGGRRVNGKNIWTDGTPFDFDNSISAIFDGQCWVMMKSYQGSYRDEGKWGSSGCDRPDVYVCKKSQQEVLFIKIKRQKLGKTFWRII